MCVDDKISSFCCFYHVTCSFYNGKPFFFQLLWWFRDFLTDPADARACARVVAAMRVSESEN